MWLSITAHGRRPPHDVRTGFGDDAAVAGGVVARDRRGPVFCADAVADPATGLLGAVAVVDRLLAGGRWLLDVALARAGALMAHRADDGVGRRGRRAACPSAAGRAAPLGRDTNAVLDAIRCRVMRSGLVVRDAEVDGVRVDVAVDGERIAAVVPAGTARAEHTIDAGGGALIPGLHDHHLHLLALAAAATSVACGPPAVTGRRALADGLGAADRTLAPSAWLRGVGYHESVAGDLDRHTLDALVPTRPCRVQHRSGHGVVPQRRRRSRRSGSPTAASSRRGSRSTPPVPPPAGSTGSTGGFGDRLPRSVPDLAAVGRRARRASASPPSPTPRR